ncbi:Hsp70 protein-domain-containing protein [Blyttiomyces helicus]|uniref:Hsp70 protein-domain-containing protein n=1 Tax=Blyttiomyces helicus TaxID=388810 RepID=A0A4P9W1M2_9FUNG|nr:Hsp70 protein-domain-containing protein [Blyttiomyces helicus]|eukprot:RKO86004.1 Hsp70 protein-domain-containing protein [Blyttiomyces helicus]
MVSFGRRITSCLKSEGRRNLQSEVDEILFVGGSSRIPRVQRLISEWFLEKPLVSINSPDTAVARGAAIHAAVLAGVHSGKIKNLRLRDVLPISLGFVRGGGLMRNQPLPTTMIALFGFPGDSRYIGILEGEHKRALQNNLHVVFELPDVSSLPGHLPKTRVTVNVDVNGTLSASTTNVCSEASLEPIWSSRLSEAAIVRMVAGVEWLRWQTRYSPTVGRPVVVTAIGHTGSGNSTLGCHLVWDGYRPGYHRNPFDVGNGSRSRTAEIARETSQNGSFTFYDSPGIGNTEGRSGDFFDAITKHPRTNGGIVIYCCKENKVDERVQRHLRALCLSIPEPFATSVFFVRTNPEWKSFLWRAEHHEKRRGPRIHGGEHA